VTLTRHAGSVWSKRFDTNVVRRLHQVSRHSPLEARRVEAVRVDQAATGLKCELEPGPAGPLLLLSSGGPATPDREVECGANARDVVVGAAIRTTSS
jgi:hypothetical protein